MESLSAYARQFLERMEKPDVDEIDGIAPPIAIKQKNTTRNPRSTVATSTELYDFFRLLYARMGRTYCPQLRHTRCSATPSIRSPRECSKSRKARAGTCCFPSAPRKTTQQLRDHLFELRSKGFNRLFQNGRIFEFSTPESLLDIDFTHAGVRTGGPHRDRARSALSALSIQRRDLLPRGGRGPLRAGRNAAAAHSCSTRSSPARRAAWSSANPSRCLFSFNNPFGACPRCQGFGNTIDYDMDLVIPDTYALARARAPSIRGPSRSTSGRGRTSSPKARARCVSTFRSAICAGRAGTRIQSRFATYFGEVETKKYKVHVRVFLSRYRGYAECPGLPRLAPARRSAVCARRRQEHRATREAEHGRSMAFLRSAWNLRRKKQPSPTRSWSRSGSG